MRVVPIRAEIRPRQNRPSRPRSAEAIREREDGSAVEAKRAPTHVTWGGRPGDPRRPPRASWNPEPAVAREAPASVVVRGPAPQVRANPRVTVTGDRGPVAVIVRLPTRRDRRVPHVAVRRVVLPRSVLIERAAVDVELGRQMRC